MYFIEKCLIVIEFCYNFDMTLKDIQKLNIIKSEILYDLDLSLLDNDKLLSLIDFIDIEEFDINTISDFDKKCIYEEVDGYLDTYKDKLELEKLLAYIAEKDYDLDDLLLFTPYDENTLNLNEFSDSAISYLKEELDLAVQILESDIKLAKIEQELEEKEAQKQELYEQECFYEEQYPETVCHFEDNDIFISLTDEIEQLQLQRTKILSELETLKQKSSNSITEDEIKKIQAKKFISPKELSILYPDMSISSQATYRGRLKDKLPFHQKKKRGKITYVVSEVEEWRKNQNWKHK